MADSVPEEKNGADKTGCIGAKGGDEMFQELVVWELSELDGEAEGFVNSPNYGFLHFIVIGGMMVWIAFTVLVLDDDEDGFGGKEGETDKGVDGCYRQFD